MLEISPGELTGFTRGGVEALQDENHVVVLA